MRWAVLMLVSGCSSILGIEDFQVGGDGGGDTPINFCLGPTGWQICLAERPTNTVTFGSATNFDTRDSPRCLGPQPKTWMDANQPDACIVTAEDIAITADLSVSKVLRSRPLVLFAANSITVSAPIDIASHAMNNQVLIGSGADPARCMNPEVPAVSTGPAGGPGGSFMQRGGNGGAGTVSASTVAKDADPTRPSVLRGGCAGANGGDSGMKGGLGGQGGGAIYLVAGNRITIDASINASGGPGGGGAIGVAGGGGGGSGGMIVLFAPTISGTGTVMANGGGGGGGAGSTAQLAMPGAEPAIASAMTAAGGGTGSGTGGRGGAGFVRGMQAVAGSTAAIGGGPGGGGGGGGGAGYIMAPANQLVATPNVQAFP